MQLTYVLSRVSQVTLVVVPSDGVVLEHAASQSHLTRTYASI